MFTLRLEEVLLPTTEQNLEFSSVRTTTQVLKEIFTRLTGHHVVEATELAIDNKLPQLSLLLGQTITTQSKTILREQLNHWLEADCLKHMDTSMIKIYMVLSGVPVCEKLNICEGMEWLRALAMHLWYLVPYHENLAEAVSLYEKAFNEESYAKKPHPVYNEDDKSKTYDILYHLMQLYNNKKLTLNQVLNPATHTSDFTDYRLSWLLLQALTSLNVGVITENGKNHIHVSFANQLEQMGHWEYAVFVLLFVKNGSVKKNLIMSVLERNLPDGDDYPRFEDFLINDLKLPPVWIHTVMVNKCKMAKNYWGEFQHSLYVCDYDRAHGVAVEHLLPGLLVNQDFDLALSVLRKFEGKEHHVLKWQYEGGLLLWFLTIRNMIMTEILDDSESVMSLQHEVVDLCQKVKYFPRHSSELSVCVSEVSKACGVLLALLLRKLDDSAREKSSSNLMSVEDLVMPPDYKTIDFEQCISYYLDNGSNSIQ